MILEVKWNQKQYQKAKKQLFDGMEQIQEIIAALGLSTTTWQFVGVFFAYVGTAFDCEICSIFTIIGEAAIPCNLKLIEEVVAKKHQSWVPSDHVQEFGDITKEILFVAQGDPYAPVTGEYIINKTIEHVEKASSLDNTILWTPEQLALQENPRQDFKITYSYTTSSPQLIRLVVKNSSKPILQSVFLQPLNRKHQIHSYSEIYLRRNITGLSLYII